MPPGSAGAHIGVEGDIPLFLFEVQYTDEEDIPIGVILSAERIGQVSNTYFCKLLGNELARQARHFGLPWDSD